MRQAKIAFTDSWLKKVSKDPAFQRKSFTDAQCRGLHAYIASDATVTFRFRTRVKGERKRYDVGLGPWSPALTVLMARSKADTLRTEIALNGIRPTRTCPTLAAAIPMYVTARQNKDRQASRRGAPLPEKWDEHLKRFKKVFAQRLPRKVSDLQRQDFITDMAAHGVERSEKTGKPWDERVLRPMMVAAMPMLSWFAKPGQRWIDPQEVEDLVPADYPEKERFLLPGEWQACAPHLDALPDECGLFPRFVLSTCVRSEQALCMEWSECNWSTPDKWIDEHGREHDCVIWIVPRDKKEGRMKGRGMGGAANKMPNRVLLVGESLAILRRLRAIWEEGQKDSANAGYTRVFTKRMVTRWRTARTEMQRGVEEKGGTKTWDRMTLRHTHATYLQAIGCPQRLITMSMVHTAHDKDGAAAITGRYIGADAARRFRENEPFAELVPWHLRLHQLIRDIEIGHMSDALATVVGDMARGQLANAMCDSGAADRKHLTVEVKSQPPKLKVVEK